MTLHEYDNAMCELTDDRSKLDEDKVGEFQNTHLREFLTELKGKATTDNDRYACEILEYLIVYSQSGSVVHYVETEEKANALRDYLNEHDLIGDMMLDSPEVYQDKYSGKWAVDCMFGGFYCPYWDGWFE